MTPMNLTRQAAAGLMALAGFALAPPSAAAPAQVTPVASPSAPPRLPTTPYAWSSNSSCCARPPACRARSACRWCRLRAAARPIAILPEPFLPSGAAPWGRVAVGVRCGGDRPWTRYVQARVSVLTDYYVAARAMAPGETISAADLEVRQGDLAALPRAVVTDPAQVAGAVAANRIAAGSPMRTDLLKKSIAVKSGQTVNVTVEGDSFQLTSEGKVLADAATGNSVQVRLRNGQVVSGLVRSGDTVVLQ